LRSLEGSTVMLFNILLLILSAVLLAYLVYALLRPEKF
jgi:K+-transporting ATPase KdpF subunit